MGRECHGAGRGSYWTRRRKHRFRGRKDFGAGRRERISQSFHVGLSGAKRRCRKQCDVDHGTGRSRIVDESCPIKQEVLSFSVLSSCSRSELGDQRILSARDGFHLRVSRISDVLR